MPYIIRKLPNQDLYRVLNKETKKIHSYATTLENAKSQVRLLEEKEGGNLEEDGKVLKPFVGRSGNKLSMLDIILPYIPPHTTYVEPFIGGGALFFNKIKSKKNVINDLEKELIDVYKTLKQGVPQSEIDRFRNMKDIKNKNRHTAEKKVTDKIHSLVKSNNRYDRLLGFFLQSRGKFNFMPYGKIYDTPSIEPYIERFPEYKRLLSGTTILSKDYAKVIKDYDSPTTFFYLDPPYEKSKTMYKNYEIDYVAINELLKTIKGKFLLSLNNSKEIRDLFNTFNQKTFVIKTKTNSSNEKTRDEILIANYPIEKYKQGGNEKIGKGIENNISTNNKMANKWITYVKNYASKNGMSYRDALRDPKCKEGYKKGGMVGCGVIDEKPEQELLAEVYNSSQLGENAGKKFISL